MSLAPAANRASGSRSRIAAVCLTSLLLATPSLLSQTSVPISFQNNPESTASKKGAKFLHATGPFEVKIDPQPADEKGGGPAIGRMLLNKQFHGDLEATSTGTMLAAGTGAKNSSGGYVAL